MSLNAGFNSNAPIAYGASFKSFTTLAALTPEQIFSPASNVNGAIVWDFSAVSRSTLSITNTLLAKSSSPTSATDGDVISTDTTYVSSTTVECATMKIPRPVFVPAGKGLYFFPNSAINSFGIRSCLYTLL